MRILHDDRQPDRLQAREIVDVVADERDVGEREPVLLGQRATAASLSSQPWTHRMSSLRLRALTTGLVSVDTIAVWMPACFSFARPRPSPRQQRTDSTPSCET